MRKWKSHKIVEAEPITVVADTITYKGVTTGEGLNAYRHEVPENFFARGRPEIGDYLVRYEDGYLSWSPKAVFEDGYRLVQRTYRPATPEERAASGEPPTDFIIEDE